MRYVAAGHERGFSGAKIVPFGTPIQDDGHAEEVTVKDELKNLKIVFTPKQKMRDAANSVELSIDRDTSGDGST